MFKSEAVLLLLITSLARRQRCRMWVANFLEATNPIPNSSCCQGLSDTSNMPLGSLRRRSVRTSSGPPLPGVRTGMAECFADFQAIQLHWPPQCQLCWVLPVLAVLQPLRQHSLLLDAWCSPGMGYFSWPFQELHVLCIGCDESQNVWCWKASLEIV